MCNFIFSMEVQEEGMGVEEEFVLIIKKQNRMYTLRIKMQK